MLFVLFWCLAASLATTAVCRAVWSPHLCASGSDQPADSANSREQPAPLAHEPAAAPPADEMGQIHRMLMHLERQQPRLAKLVLLCWIGGMSSQMAAATLGLAVETVERDLHFAHSLLRQQIGPADLD